MSRRCSDYCTLYNDALEHIVEFFVGWRVHSLVGVYLEGKRKETVSELKLFSSRILLLYVQKRIIGGIIDDFLLTTKNMSKMMVAMVISP